MTHIGNSPRFAESEPVLTLIKGGRLFTPADFGVGDILLAGGTIAAVADHIETPVGVPIRTVQAHGCLVTPGLIDLHVHITGGGGEGGPATRVPEIKASDIMEAGVTTVVGLLGTDDVSRTPAQLLVKALGLEQEGLRAFILSGSYAFPPLLTVTGSLKKDLTLIPHVVGVGELAISDHRSAEPTFNDLAKAAAEARVGGMLGLKAGLVNLHMGSGSRGMEPLFRLVRETDIPIGQLLPTHCNRNDDLLEQTVDFVDQGGKADVTVFDPENDEKFGVLTKGLDRLLDGGRSLDAVTLSSDANGSLPRFDAHGNFIGMGAGSIHVLRQVMRRLIADHGRAPETVLPLVTSNAAARLKLSHRIGSLALGLAADVTIFHPDWTVREMYCRGRVVVENGKCLRPNAF